MVSVRIAVPLAAGLGAAMGIAAGLWSAGAFDPPTTAPAPHLPLASGDLHDEIATLRLSLATLREENARLEEELEALRLEVEWFRTASAASGDAAADPSRPAGAASDREEAEAAAVAAIPAWFDVDALIERGIAAPDAERLRERFDENEMRLLYLQDRATRGGWAGTQRYRVAARAVRDQLRRELGDDDFDLMLYAAGRNNRVIVQDVLTRSPARDSGLRDGDVVVRYDGTQIFDAFDLRAATAGGSAGTPTALEVMRDGEIVRLYVPRGPLGARLRHGRRPPDTLY